MKGGLLDEGQAGQVRRIYLLLTIYTTYNA